MSEPRECTFYEIRPGKWIYTLETSPNSRQYEGFGVFNSREEINNHLSKHFANPGGMMICSFDYVKENTPIEEIRKAIEIVDETMTWKAPDKWSTGRFKADTRDGVTRSLKRKWRKFYDSFNKKELEKGNLPE